MKEIVDHETTFKITKMKKIITVIMMLLIFGQMLRGQCDGWVRQGGCTTNIDRGAAVITDHSGNIYVNGQFSDIAVFSGHTIVSTSYEDIYLAKYDSTGNLVWIKGMGSYNTDYPGGLTLDNNNNIYITGTIASTATFDTITLNNTTGGSLGFVAKYNNSGSVVWVRPTGGCSMNGCIGVACKNNSLYITGGSGISYDNYFLAKMDLNGNIIWSHSGVSTDENFGVSIALDNAENVFVTGGFFADMTIDTMTFINQGYYDMFLAKYDSTGQVIWAKSAGSWGDDFVGGIAIDTSCNLYVSLSGTSPITFDTIAIDDYGDKDIMLVKYDSNGHVNWAKYEGGMGRDIANGVSVSPDNKIYVVGNFEGNVTFGTHVLNLPAFYLFLAEYDFSGNVDWVNYSPDDQYYGASGVTCDGNNNVFVNGWIGVTPSTFDGTSLTADNNGGDAVLWKVCKGSIVNKPNGAATTTMYPNPNSGNFMFTYNLRNLSNAKLKIVDYMGNEIYSYFLQDTIGSKRIDVSSLNNGLYFWDLMSDSGVIDGGKIAIIK